MTNYKKLESVEVTVNENYSIIAEVNKDTTDANRFHCNLWLHDMEAGVRILIKEDVTVNSSPASMCDKVAQSIETLINRKYFDDDIKTMQNFINYVVQLKDGFSNDK